MRVVSSPPETWREWPWWWEDWPRADHRRRRNRDAFLGTRGVIQNTKCSKNENNAAEAEQRMNPAVRSVISKRLQTSARTGNDSPVECGEHPIADAGGTAHSRRVKQNRSSQQQIQKPTGASLSAAADFQQDGVTVKPSADEVARRAYFSYENQGSQHGQDVQHWLAAETELSAKRNLT